MKSFNYIKMHLIRVACLCVILCIGKISLAQNTDSTASEPKAEGTTIKKFKPVKNTFESIWLIDNQTVIVPVKNTFEMDILHRFGTMGNGYEDFYGLFASSNIKLGFNYVPIDNLLVGVSLAKSYMTVEGYAKYAVMQQTKGKYPVSISYYTDVAWDSRPGENYTYPAHEFMFFNQLMIARKITDKLSVQVSPSLTHINYVNGYFEAGKTQSGTDTNVIANERKHDHFAIAFLGRYKLTQNMSLIVNYDQPITKHKTDNPNPNLSIGLEVGTGSHSFQFFIANYPYLVPQRNNYFNQNDYKDGWPWQADNKFLIGFNITRLWNY